MKTKFKSLILSAIICVTSIPFAGNITANAEDYPLEILSSDYYNQEVDWNLWDKFLKYDLCITDYDALTAKEQELCKFIFETERSASGTVICERARRQLAGDNVGERITIEEVESSETYLISHENEDFTMNLCFDDYIPDMVYPDYDMDGFEYWINDEGTERILCGIADSGYVYVRFTDEYSDDVCCKLDGKYVIAREIGFKEASSEKLIEFEGNYYILNTDNTVSLLRNKTSYNAPLYPEPVEETISIPEEINGYPVTRIEACAFQYSAATKVVLPQTVTHIGDWAFDSSLHLTEINIPESLEYLGEGAFINCSSLSEIKINCPELILREFTFFSSGLNCADIKVKSIGKRAFEITPITDLVLYEGLELIEANAFWGCRSITDVNIPSTVNIIGQGAFGAKELSSITIPESVTILGSYLSRSGSIMTSIAGEIPGNDPLTDEPVCVFDLDCVINGWYNTEAHRYALEWGLKFNPMDEDVAYGDINLDGEINMADMVLLQSYLTGNIDTIGYEADLIADGVIDAFDMIRMRQTIKN